MSSETPCDRRELGDSDPLTAGAGGVVATDAHHTTEPRKRFNLYNPTVAAGLGGA